MPTQAKNRTARRTRKRALAQLRQEIKSAGQTSASAQDLLRQLELSYKRKRALETRWAGRGARLWRRSHRRYSDVGEQFPMSPTSTPSASTNPPAGFIPVTPFAPLRHLGASRLWPYQHARVHRDIILLGTRTLNSSRHFKNWHRPGSIWAAPDLRSARLPAASAWRAANGPVTTR